MVDPLVDERRPPALLQPDSKVVCRRVALSKNNFRAVARKLETVPTYLPGSVRVAAVRRQRTPCAVAALSHIGGKLLGHIVSFLS